MIMSQFVLSAPDGMRPFFLTLPRAITPWMHTKLHVAWITLATFMTLLLAIHERVPRPCFATNFKKEDFAKPVSLRASRNLRPVSRFRIAQIMPLMNRASRASRPGLTVGLLRILCNGL